MNTIRLVSAVVLASTCLLSVVGVLVVKPENTAGKGGSHDVLKCQGSDPEDRNRYTWYEVVPGGSDKAITEDDFVFVEYRQHYSILGNHEAFEYNLNISFLASTSGPHRCNQLRPADDALAYVIAVVSDPVCNSSLPPGSSVSEDEIIAHTCEIGLDSIHPMDWRPVITWSSSDGQTLESVDNSSSDILKTTVEAKAAVQVSAKMHFVFNGTLPEEYAQNEPAYNWSYVSPTLDIKPGPEPRSGLSKGAIIGIAVGGVAFVALVVGGGIFFKYKTTKKNSLTTNETKGLKSSS